MSACSPHVCSIILSFLRCSNQEYLIFNYYVFILTQIMDLGNCTSLLSQLVGVAYNPYKETNK